VLYRAFVVALRAFILARVLPLMIAASAVRPMGLRDGSRHDQERPASARRPTPSLPLPPMMPL
jgi:hypothetical protein